jgi:hypothetical protein
MALMDRHAKIEKINAEIARMEVEYELMADNLNGGVQLGSGWALPGFKGIFGVSAVSPAEVVSEKSNFLQKVLTPALAKMGKSDIVPESADVSELEAVFSSCGQPQTGFYLNIPGVANKIYILLYVNSGGVSYAVAKVTASSEQTKLHSDRPKPYRLASSTKGEKVNFLFQISHLQTAIEVAISK